MLTNTDELVLILLIGVFADLKFFLIGIVAWIDANFFYPFGSLKCRIWFKVNICNKWYMACLLYTSDAADD